MDLIHEMFEAADVGLAVLDAELRVVHINHVLTELSAASRENQAGRSLEEVIPALAPHVRPHARAVLETGLSTPQQEILLNGPDRQAEQWFASCWPLRNEERTRVIGVGLRLHRAARKGVEDALRRNEAQFRAVCDASPIGVFLTDETGSSFYENAASLAQMSLSAEEARGYGWQRAIHPDDRQKVQDGFVAATKNGAVYRGVNRYLHRDGRIVLVDVKASAINDGEKLIGYVGMVEDITERAAAEGALRESELRFRQLAENIGAVFWLRAANRSQVYYISPAFEKIWGRPVAEALRRPTAFMDALVPEDRERVNAYMKSPDAVPAECEYRITRPDGTVAWILDRRFPVRDEDGVLVRVAGIASDVTTQKMLEGQLLQAHKLDSIGRLAGGVAHDFNNLLTVILNQGIMAHRACDAGRPPREELALIQDAAQQATEVTRQLLAFARRQPFAPAPVDPNELTDRLARFLRRLVGERVELVLSHEPDVGILRGDRAQLDQVVVNLALNARDAMPDGGKLSIVTRNVTVDAESEGDVPAGEWVTILVEDTGRGISEADRAHIFEPFFSTKSPVEGTGLGLASCYGIVKQHGGHVVVRSAVGQGTTFELFFPRVDGNGTAPVVTSSGEQALPRGTETILVVEDEPAVRRTAVRVLASSGFVVLEATDGEHALEVLREKDGRVDLVLTDIVMPKLGGAELGAALRKRHPKLRVLYTSGYPHGSDLRDEDGVALPFLGKPYVPSTLLRAVREALDARRARA